MARTNTSQSAGAKPVVSTVDSIEDELPQVDAEEAVLSREDPESLYRIVVHRQGCPQQGGQAGMDTDKDGNQGQGWGWRMEVYERAWPADSTRAAGSTHLVRCIDCGAQIRVDNL